ncbi:aminotransferase class I/II-fold pyridoxal phosphate-dependent enzyme [bacterium]|nr:aminotransferase class I/II-fold pyridoxal phosphate-dependent enzyme [bacterium]MBP9806876.1 aminotransferase class I/II-fold pyridoxal phosphate-dependent enzyme [bacterium]
MQSKTRKIASNRANQFQESVIREMSRLSAQHQAVNLAQGLPDFPCPPELKEAVTRAVFDDVNQYAITWGDKFLRQAITEQTKKFTGLTIEPETDITVCCGATEAMVATMLALVDPGDEVVVFEPFYENYGPDSILCGAVPRYVKLHAPNWTFDEDELAKAFNENTRAIIINTPHNPTGKVFNLQEMTAIANLCQKYNVLALTDEIYEHILYDGAKHVSMAALPGMADLTVTINSLSKTYSVTGWRVGWAIAKPELTLPIRKVHDFLTVGSPAPLQRAAVTAINMPDKYYADLKAKYAERRAMMLEILDGVGIPYYKPEGAYYAFCDISGLGFKSDMDFTKYLVKDVGVAVVPGGSFFGPEAENRHNYVRFCFSRKEETMLAAKERLKKLKG